MIETEQERKVPAMKIYGTIGPACSEENIMHQMFVEGMTGFRLNLSHTSLNAAEDQINTMHRAAQKAGIKPDLLIDMQGPELRIGGGYAPKLLMEGTKVVLSSGYGNHIPVSKQILEVLEPGQDILLDDGRILCRVTKASPERANVEVIRGGILRPRKSIALPGVSLSLPVLTELDRENIAVAKDYGVTGIMQPFVRDAEDLKAVQKEIAAVGAGDLRILAKIENQTGLDNMEELIPYADEIVIARGDLGNTIDLWEVPAAQKDIADLCQEAGRDFMVVTQMLTSMEHAPVPTRAEVSDIFNAVLDGASSVMVTGETAIGEYPVEVIHALVSAVHAAERYLEDLDMEE